MKRFLVCSVLFCALAIANADKPFRDHRYDMFSMLKNNTTDIVMVGNSITDMHDWREAFNNNKIVNRGNSGALSGEILENIDNYVAGKPKKLFLLIGTNDLGNPRVFTPEVVAENIEKIVLRIKELSPKTKIHINSIFPSIAGARTTEKEQETNALIREICQRYNLTYIDMWDDLLNITYNQSNSLDGLHLLVSGYEKWCKKLEPYIGSKCVYPKDTENITEDMPGSYGMRTSYFGMLPVYNGDILMIGDEMIKCGEWSELLQNQKVKNRGSGWGLYDVGMDFIAKELPVMLRGYTAKVKPEALFLYAGSKELLRSDKDIDSITEDYIKLINQMKTSSFGAKIFIMNLLPVRNPKANETRIMPFNERLASIADSDEQLELIDVYSLFANGSEAKAEYICNNYLYGSGYIELAKVINTKLKK